MTTPNTTAALGIVTTTDDAYGNPGVRTVAWSKTDAIWWPEGSSEAVNGQDQVAWQNTLCLPTGTSVKATDEAVPQPVLDQNGELVLGADGVTPVSADGGKPFQVDGQPAAYPTNSSGWQHPYSVVVSLQRVSG